MFSVVADVKIRVIIERKNELFTDHTIDKTYGQPWNYENEGFTINFNQLISGVS